MKLIKKDERRRSRVQARKLFASQLVYTISSSFLKNGVWRYRSTYTTHRVHTSCSFIPNRLRANRDGLFHNAREFQIHGDAPGRRPNNLAANSWRAMSIEPTGGADGTGPVAPTSRLVDVTYEMPRAQSSTAAHAQ